MPTISSSVSTNTEHLPETRVDEISKVVHRRLGHKGNAAHEGWYRGFELGMTFCRLTEELASQPGTKIEKETRGLERALSTHTDAWAAAASVNVVDLGTGDGRKASKVMAALRESGARSIRYVPVDTNPHISRYAIFTILGGGRREWTRREAEGVFGALSDEQLAAAEVHDDAAISIERLVRLSTIAPMRAPLLTRREVTVPTTGLKIDFLGEPARLVEARSTFMPRAVTLYCLLGNTLGNWSVDQRRTFLGSLRSQLEAEDRLLLGVSLRPSAVKCSLAASLALEREHLPAEVFMRLGADEADSRFCVRHDRASSSMIYGFERRDGSVQDMGFSYLFDADELAADLSEMGFRVERCSSHPRSPDQVAGMSGDIEPRYLTLLAVADSPSDGGCR